MSQRAIVYDLLNQRWQTFSYPVNRSYGYVFQPSQVVPERVLMADSNQSIWQQDNAATSDGTYDILRRWQSSALAGQIPHRSVEVETVAVEYQSAQTSALTMAVYNNRGESITTQRQFVLAPASVMSRIEWTMQVSCRYPVIEFQSSATTHTLFRAEVGFNVRGR